MRLGGCSVVRCQKRSHFDHVAMCEDHLRPHLKAMERAKVTPFGNPTKGRREMHFNGMDWMYFREQWRVMA